MKLTFYGHSTFLIEHNNTQILTDPFISPVQQEININDIKADTILLSHGHQDHVADTETIAKNNNSLIVSNFEIIEYFKNKGLEGYPMNIGGKKTFDFGTLKCVNAVHSSALPDGSYGGNPMGFVIWNEEKSFYFAGDTALHMDMKLIPQMCPKLDFAILPIGDNFTMGYEDAIIACEFIQCKKVIACHFDTFGLIEIDQKEVKKAFEDAGIELIIPEVKQEIIL